MGLGLNDFECNASACGVRLEKRDADRNQEALDLVNHYRRYHTSVRQMFAGRRACTRKDIERCIANAQGNSSLKERGVKYCVLWITSWLLARGP